MELQFIRVHCAVKNIMLTTTTATTTKMQVLRQSKCAAVDQLAAELVARFSEQGCPLPLRRHSDFVYQLGNRKVSLSVISGKLVVRHGASYVDFLEFLETARF